MKSPFNENGYKPPKISYGDLSKEGALGIYLPETQEIILDKMFDFKSGTPVHPDLIKAKQNVIRHETKHHHQLYELGKEGLAKRYEQDYIQDLEETDPLDQAMVSSKEEHEIAPEIKTARKYQSINPNLIDIAENRVIDRYDDEWFDYKQYEKSGTIEHEAKQAEKKASPGLFRIQRDIKRKRRR